jgi:sortase A
MLKKLAGSIFILLGLLFIIVVVYPVANYFAISKQKFPSLISPIEEQNNEYMGSLDYTQASNWFSNAASSEDFNLPNISYYTISIPALKISNATVAIGGEDLSKNLIHYPGTALPGKIGNAVIFGHSVLPIFYDPEDYLAIFSTLPTINEFNEIFVDYDGISYKYLVEDMFEVTPEDIQIMEQDSSNSYLTLVTCTPPGDPRKPKRLIVRAKLVPVN